ncbi:MAG: hypothetical protein AAFN70_01590 [Planctomycetota bacterium]
MPIAVTCPSCLTRFNVSEKFAGKSGPCPKCQKTIQIPKESEAVVIHAPAADGPTDRAGRPVLQPIERKETDVTKLGLAITIGLVVLAFLIALGFRFTGGLPLPGALVVAILLGPVCAWTGYTFTHDADLEPFRGRELWTRAGICGGVMGLLWVIYWFVPAYVLELDAMQYVPWVYAGMMLAVMVALGAGVVVVSLELEFIGGILIAGLYVTVTFALALVAGIAMAGVPELT